MRLRNSYSLHSLLITSLVLNAVYFAHPKLGDLCDFFEGDDSNESCALLRNVCGYLRWMILHKVFLSHKLAILPTIELSLQANRNEVWLVSFVKHDLSLVERLDAATLQQLLNLHSR